MRISKALSVIAVLLLAGLTLDASTIVNVTFEGTSGVTDSAGDQVLPYFLSINGGPNVAADCYDFFDSISVGQSWNADVDTLAEAVASGKFSSSPGALHGYELIGVLSTLAALTPQNDIDLQQAMWDVFDPGAFTIDAGISAYMATANADLPTFNFARIEFLEPVAGVNAQPFALLVAAPEPANAMLAGLAGRGGGSDGLNEKNAPALARRPV